MSPAGPDLLSTCVDVPRVDAAELPGKESVRFEGCKGEESKRARRFLEVPVCTSAGSSFVHQGIR